MEVLHDVISLPLYNCSSMGMLDPHEGPAKAFEGRKRSMAFRDASNRSKRIPLPDLVNGSVSSSVKDISPEGKCLEE